MESVPRFRYHPDPTGTGAFTTDSAAECDCCGRPTEICYTGPFYSEEEIDALCPSCIADGSAAETLNGEFQDSASIESISPNPGIPSLLVNSAAVEEVTTRTPGYRGLQQEVWLSHCDDLCAFIGYACWDTVEDRLEEFSDLESDVAGYGLAVTDLSRYLVAHGDLQGYLFRCLHCRKYRLHLDST